MSSLEESPKIVGFNFSLIPALFPFVAHFSLTDNFFSLYNVSAEQAVASDAFDKPFGLPPLRPRALAAVSPFYMCSRITSREKFFHSPHLSKQ